ncbi:DUF3307 domain-containing protein, partial [Francisellaceae bacterium]|nr:DUF3307 domain-containing protein [Francisellaceae bacterium]
RVKHFLCDWILQTKSMATKKGLTSQDGGYKALFSHTLIHSMGTFIITLIFCAQLWWLAIIDFLIHSAIDRTKATAEIKLSLQPNNKYFWWLLGFDQELHHLTHFAFIITILVFMS